MSTKEQDGKGALATRWRQRDDPCTFALLHVVNPRTYRLAIYVHLKLTKHWYLYELLTFPNMRAAIAHARELDPQMDVRKVDAT